MTASSPVRVLLVDDQSLFREALATLLGVREEVEVVGEAADGAEALVRRRLQPDVVLMDLRMPVLDGIAATRRLRPRARGRVIALTTFDTTRTCSPRSARARRLPAQGRVSGRLVEAVLAAARGESVLQPSVAAKVVAGWPRLPDGPSRARARSSSRSRSASWPSPAARRRPQQPRDRRGRSSSPRAPSRTT